MGRLLQEAVFAGNPTGSSEKTRFRTDGARPRGPYSIGSNDSIQTRSGDVPENPSSLYLARRWALSATRLPILRDHRNRCQFIPVRIGHITVRLSPLAPFPLASMSQDIIAALHEG